MVTSVIVIEALFNLETLIPALFSPYFSHKFERIGYA